jgi:hypothetical protein
LGVSACGGSSKTTSTTTAATVASQTTTAATTPTTPVKSASGKPLTRAQLIAAGEAICKSANTKRQAVSVITKKDLGRVVPEIAIYDTTEANELSQLVPPASMAGIWSQILRDFQAYGQEVSMMGQYAQANNTVAFRRLYEKSELLHEKLHEVAARAGFNHCARFI